MAKIIKYSLKNGDVRYSFQVYLGIDPQTGKKKITTRRGFKTKKEANLALSKINLDLNEKGKLPTQNNILFQTVYKEWYQQYINTVRESTWNRTAGMFDKHILPEFGHKRIQTITVDDCQQALNKWYNEVSRNYKRWFNYVKQVFKYALKRGYIEKDVTELVTMPVKKEQSGDKPLNFWSRTELEQFFKCIDLTNNTEKYCLFRVLAFTGIRRGECLALTWEDVDFKLNTLRINKTLTQGENGKQIIQAPKTSHGRRTIILDNKTVDILKQWRLKQKIYYLHLGVNIMNDNQLVFANSLNRFKSLNTPSKWLKKIVKDNGLKPITIHGFRHTHASALFSAGASIKEVQMRLGHSDVQTTLNIYTHVTPEQNKNAINKLANYLTF